MADAAHCLSNGETLIGKIMKPASRARSTVYFCFANPPGFSGQKAATELVMTGLRKRGWRCRPLPLPLFDRSGTGRFALVRFLWAVLVAWSRCLRLLISPGSALCVNLGQTRPAFLRDAIPLLLGWLGLGRRRLIISLHGSLFMNWDRASVDGRLFRFLLLKAGIVTVLGARQSAHLVALGIPADRVRVVINSCSLELASTAAVTAKHRRADERPVVRCLYLSSLIDTKGYPEYLEALLRLADLPGVQIEAVLCGRLVPHEFSQRFIDATSAENWIEQQMAAINRSVRVKVRWVKGAVGKVKSDLFTSADVFVLPTRYPVEAQPLVLLEAMASGCALVTTRAGEIPTILDEQSAVFLTEPSTESLALSLQVIVASTAMRARLALAAHSRFVKHYQLDRHLDVWENILAAPARSSGGGP